MVVWQSGNNVTVAPLHAPSAAFSLFRSRARARRLEIPPPPPLPLPLALQLIRTLSLNSCLLQTPFSSFSKRTHIRQTLSSPLSPTKHAPSLSLFPLHPSHELQSFAVFSLRKKLRCLIFGVGAFLSVESWIAFRSELSVSPKT